MTSTRKRFIVIPPRFVEVTVRLITAIAFLVSTLSLSIDNVNAQDELELALMQVRDETVISGDLSTQIIATFPAVIPQVVVDAGFKINSRIILGEELPAGTTVTITRNGSPYLTDITFAGTQHWVTELFGYPLSYAAPFDAGYGGDTETYVITFAGNPVPLNTTLTLQSVISRDDFATDFYELDSAQFDLIQDVTDPLLAMQYVKDDTTIAGTLNELIATFPAVIPAVIVDDSYQINSRMTLGEALPAGSKVSITLAVNGGTPFPYVTDALIPGVQFWITDLIPDAVAAEFDTGYANRVEVYAISITSGGGNLEPVDTTVQIESIISKDEFITLEVLDSITLDVDLPADNSAALQYVKDNTTLTGTLGALTAAFPESIPSVLVAQGYKINSRMTLGEALPTGSTVSVKLSVNGGDPVAYVTDVLIPGVQFWVTDLIPGEEATDFDAGYASRVEVYAISITGGGGNLEPVDTTVQVESIISKDGFVTLEVLDSITLDVDLPADNAAALQYVKDNTTLTGTLGDLTAAFPESIPSVLVAQGNKINSRMTLGDALPTGSTVSVTLSVNGGDPVAYVTDVLIPGVQFWITDLIPDAVAAEFDTGYANRVEVYAISITSGGGNLEPVDTTVQIESIISKDDFVTLELLDSITLDVDFPADNAAALQYVKDNTTLTGTLGALTAAFPESIPSVLVAQGYQINSRMTLAESLPAGSTVSITLAVNGGTPFPYVADVLIPATQFWVTDLIPGEEAADFDAGYADRIEVYSITIIGGGGNPEPVDTTVQIESIISNDDFETLEVLDSITLDVDFPADEAAALQYVIDNTTLTGPLTALREDFPPTIPAVIVDKPYKVNSLLTFGEALPAGSTISITLSVNGGDPAAYVTDALIPGTQFWITDLVTGSSASDFDAGYADRVELYNISITRGDYPIAFDTTLTIKSILSADGFTTRHILGEVTRTVLFMDDTGPSLTISGLTADGNPLAGDLASGYILDTLNDPAVSYGLQFAPGTAVNEPLQEQYFALYLTDATLTPEDLVIYFNSRALPAQQLTYMLGVANADNPFAYLKGDTLQLLDAYQHDEQTTDMDLQIPDDFPLGDYTLAGSIRDLAGNSSPVTVILQVADGQSGDKPTIRVYPDTNIINGDNWTSGRPVYLSVEGDPYGSLLPALVEVEKEKKIWVVTFNNLGLDLVPGMLVKMFDGRFTRTHEIIDIKVTAVDITANRVSGTADPGLVETMAYSNGSYEWKDVIVSSSRTWTATYEHVDILPGAYGTVRQFDALGNSTRVYWEIPQAYMVVYPQIDLVRGYGFSPGIQVSLDIAAGEYTDSTTSAGNGFVEFPLSGYYDVQPGQLVVMQGGFVTREHIVRSLGVTRIEQSSDDVIGTAAADAAISVAGFDDIGYGASIDVTADSDGNWLADFSGHEDLKVGTYGYVVQPDADWDYSRVDYVITHELPVLTAISPTYTTAGSGPLTLLVTGSNFVDGYSTIYWNGNPRTTTFISETQLSIELSPADLAVAGAATIRVYNDYYDSGFSAATLSLPVIAFTPALGGELALNTVSFDWDDIPGATKYRIEISLNEEFNPVIVSTRTSLSSYAYQTPLVNGQQYYWRVQPRYGLTWSGEWSPVLTFLSRNPPAAPELHLPEYKTHTNGNDVTLEWFAADRAERYLLQLATDPLFSNKTSKTLPPGELQKMLPGIAEGKYYWRVRGVREVDGVIVKGPWSAVWIFKVDRTPPAVPSLMRPRDGAEKDKIPAFAWYAATGAKLYNFEYRIKGSTNEEDWVSSTALTVLSYKPLEMTDGTYEWRVRALDKAGNESISLTRTVTINLP